MKKKAVAVLRTIVFWLGVALAAIGLSGLYAELDAAQDLSKGRDAKLVQR